uniref:Uncharacterized protein n=1 Tax=Panagrellus redivivus TaxID=6233 RepID=A0A7E4VPY8_PANRE
MKLFLTAFIVVLMLSTVMAEEEEDDDEDDEEDEENFPPSWIYCYTRRRGHEALNYTFREERINGTYRVRIRKCKFCEYKLKFWADGSKHNPFRNIFVTALWEYFTCHREGEIEREHVCKAPEFYENLRDPYNIAWDRIICDTDLCNKPCYKDPVLPPLPPTTTELASTTPKRRRRKKSKGFSVYSFGVVMLLRYITAFMMLFK